MNRKYTNILKDRYQSYMEKHGLATPERIDWLNYNISGYLPTYRNLAAWRLTKGIYRYDQVLREAVSDTKLNKGIPVTQFERLPQWCIGIETPGMQEIGSEIVYSKVLGQHYNRFAWVPVSGYLVSAFPRDDDEISLHITPVPEGQDKDALLTMTATLNLRSGVPLQKSIEDLFEYSMKEEDNLIAERNRVMDELCQKEGIDRKQYLYESKKQVINLALYLTSEQPDLAGEPANPQPKKTKKKGLRLFAANKPEIWDVGVRVGSAIRKAREQTQNGEARDGAGRRMIPHVRDAHWHTYRYGEGRVYTKVKWLSPILVNADIIEEQDRPATVRPVKSRKQ